MTKIDRLLHEIDTGLVLLPEFQRGFVWKREQVRRLWDSLYQGFPIGSVLLWETSVGHQVSVRGDSSAYGPRVLILDGQQRITAIYTAVRGKMPEFFEGDPTTLNGLHFHLGYETFAFWKRSMHKDQLWVDVREVFADTAAAQLEKLDPTKSEMATYAHRLTRLNQSLTREIPEERITAEEDNVETVVEIFNRINAAGTRLTKGDLALAHLTTVVPKVRGLLRDSLDSWESSGFRFSRDWLLRVITATATGRSSFHCLSNLEADSFRNATSQAIKHVNTILSAVTDRLGLDHDRVLFGRSAWPVLCRVVENRQGKLTSDEVTKLLRWYVHAHLAGRYASSSRTTLGRDLHLADSAGIDGLLTELEAYAEHPLVVQPSDYDGRSTRAVGYPLLYGVLRSRGIDIKTGKPLKAANASVNADDVYVRSIFPESSIASAGFSAGAIANLFLGCSVPTQPTNPNSDYHYLQLLREGSTNALDSQCIPRDPSLWRPHAYQEFIRERRRLLANRLNEILGLGGHSYG